MTRCAIAGCKTRAPDDAPPLCPDHWQQLPKARRKYLADEFRQGARFGWRPWSRKTFADLVATLTEGMQ